MHLQKLEVTTKECNPPNWLRQARELLHAHFNDSLNLDEIASAVGVHPTHLARTFKKHYRTTVGEYVRRLRLDWATRRLSETEESIAEIASSAGFYDQSHFSHLFKLHTGFTPAEFRSLLERRGLALLKS
jgi:AraC family transcriptional regulator